MTKFLRFRDLRERGVVNSWKMVKWRIEHDGFPVGRTLGPNTRVWTDAEIEYWLSTRPTEPKAARSRGRPRKAVPETHPQQT